MGAQRPDTEVRAPVTRVLGPGGGFFRLDGQRRQVGNLSYEMAAPRWRVGNGTCDGRRGILGWNVRSAASRHRAGQIVARAAALPSDEVAFPTPRGVTEISRG